MTEIENSKSIQKINETKAGLLGRSINSITHKLVSHDLVKIGRLYIYFKNFKS